MWVTNQLNESNWTSQDGNYKMKTVIKFLTGFLLKHLAVIVPLIWVNCKYPPVSKSTFSNCPLANLNWIQLGGLLPANKTFPQLFAATFQKVLPLNYKNSFLSATKWNFFFILPWWKFRGAGCTYHGAATINYIRLADEYYCY